MVEFGTNLDSISVIPTYRLVHMTLWSLSGERINDVILGETCYASDNSGGIR